MISSIVIAAKDAGLSSFFYNLFFIAGFVGVLSFNLLNAKNYKMSLLKALVFTVIVYSLAVLWMFFLFWAESGFKNWGGNNIVRVFVWIPLIALPISRIMKLDWYATCDYLAPCPCVVHGIAHFGCIFAGCCHGYPWARGIYNPELGVPTFPTQPIEAITAVLIAVIVYARCARRRFEPDGLAYPIMLMLFGYSRFLFEFLRDNDKLFWGISSLALHALAAAVVGTIAYFIISRKNKAKAVQTA